MLLVLVFRITRQAEKSPAAAAAPLAATYPGSNQHALLQKAELGKSSPSLEHPAPSTTNSVPLNSHTQPHTHKKIDIFFRRQHYQ